MKVPKRLIADIEMLRRKDGYLAAGYPRFMGLFGRDSIISSLQLLDYDPGIARSTLLKLSDMQGSRIDASTAEEPGKILHEYDDPKFISKEWFWIFRSYRGWLRLGVPVYFSVDSTPLFIILAHRYLKKTGDGALIARIWKSIDLAASWISKYGLSDGLLSYRTVSSRIGLASQSWKDGPNNSFERMKGRIAVVEAQGYAYAAAKSAFDLSDSMNKELSSMSENTADLVKERFNERFWDRAGTDALAVSGEKTVKLHSSNTGHLLFTGILDRSQERSVIDSIFDDSIMTEYGIRTESSDSGSFDQYSYQRGAVWPHDNWIIAEGLKKRGYLSNYHRIRRSILSAFRERGNISEFFGVEKGGKLIPDWKMRVPPCSPQAWSTGAVIDFIIGAKEIW